MAQHDFWEKLKQRVREVSIAAADFTEEQALIGKLKFDILNLKRKVDRCYRDMGERLMELYKADPSTQPFDDEEIARLIRSVTDNERHIAEKQQEINEVADYFRTRAESRQKTAAEEAKRTSKPTPSTTGESKPQIKSSTQRPATPKSKSTRKKNS